ncbi:MAG: asparagine--tRNA ligase, partial [Calditrichaeota bacterium]|nr:asparagine--tRNA ligase [Calditrichota bacterium]
MQTYISEIAAHEGQTVTIKGWLYNARSGGKIRFLLVRDGTGIIQCVASLGDLGEKTIELIDTLAQESSIIVTGTVRADKRAP